jgi:hypothetical protein
MWKGGETLKVKAVIYASWVTAATAVLAAFSFIMLALSLHHSTRSLASNSHTTSSSSGGISILGMHDGSE